MDLDQETAKELVKSVIDGFEEESIVNAESVTLFLCRECLPYLTKMNIPANIVQAVNGLAEKNEDLTAAGSLTDLVIAQDGRLLLPALAKVMNASRTIYVKLQAVLPGL